MVFYPCSINNIDNSDNRVPLLEVHQGLQVICFNQRACIGHPIGQGTSCKVSVSATPVNARFVPSAVKTADFGDAATNLAPRCAIKTIVSSPSALPVLACPSATICLAYSFELP